MQRSGRKSYRRKTLDKTIRNVYNKYVLVSSFIPFPFMRCESMEGLFFDPRFDYFVRRKESQNCEFGDCTFQLIALQSSIIKGLQGD
nr:MAG TPA: hypothetical protein [Caudoviricetes sp.]